MKMYDEESGEMIPLETYDEITELKAEIVRLRGAAEEPKVCDICGAGELEWVEWMNLKKQGLEEGR